MGVDSGRDSVGQGWVAPQETPECGAIQRSASQQQGGGEETLLIAENVEADRQLLPWDGVVQLVVETHGEKWRHMEILGEAVASGGAHHVGMAVVPGRVLHLGHERGDRSRATGRLFTIGTEVQADGIEQPTPGTQVGQQGRPGPRGAGRFARPPGPAPPRREASPGPPGSPHAGTVTGAGQRADQAGCRPMTSSTSARSSSGIATL